MGLQPSVGHVGHVGGEKLKILKNSETKRNKSRKVSDVSESAEKMFFRASMRSENCPRAGIPKWFENVKENTENQAFQWIKAIKTGAQKPT